MRRDFVMAIPYLAVIVFLALSGSAVAGTESETTYGTGMQNAQSLDSSGVRDFLVLQPSIALGSWVAAEEPNLTGGLLLLATIFFISDSKGSSADTSLSDMILGWLGLLGPVVAYNLSIDEDDYDEDEVFLGNYLLWNLGFAVAYSYNESWDNHRQSTRPSQSQYFTALQPISDGIALTMSYRF